MKKISKAYIFTSLTILFWAGAATAFKIALQYLSPYQLLFYSVAVSCISLLIILLFQKKLKILFRLPRVFLFKSALLGLLNPFLFYVILFKAYDLLPGQMAMALNFGWPITLAVLSVPVLKQKMSKRQLLAIFISFIGAVIIATKGAIISFSDINQFGVMLALVSTFIWATYWLINTKDTFDPVLRLFSSFCFGLLYTLLASPLLGALTLPEPAAWLPILYVGVFEMGVTFVLWISALKIAPSTARISNFIYLTPFLSLLVLNVIINEQIFPSTFLGLLLIVSSILFQEIYKTRKT